MLGASKSCFIASPTEAEVAPLLELLSEKLAKAGVEAIIAVRERAYGQDIFCTKICGKIIESMFCVVILDDMTKDGKQMPNPNVYYEYGLMTALGKHVIPLQKEGLKLAFNIQTHDTVKYGPQNLGPELERAIRDALKITSSVEVPMDSTRLSDKSLMHQFEIAGVQIKGDSWFLANAISDTYFLGLGTEDYKWYGVVARIDDETEVSSALEDTNVLVYRIEKAEAEKTRLIPPLKAQLAMFSSQVDSRYHAHERGSLEEKIKETEDILRGLRKIYFGFIVKQGIDKGSLSKRVTKLLEGHPKFEVIVDNNGEIRFGDTVVSLTPITSTV
jgi:hypothetical protein